MRLINTSTHELEDILDRHLPKYAILSHTWGEKEVSFQEYTEVSDCLGKGDYCKINEARKLAARNRYTHIWIDTCCIDKRSSAELQEAINSMYRYYQEAAVCYVHLADVFWAPVEADGQHHTNSRPWLEEFRKSRWFTRGWTLQELIATKGDMCFYSHEWNFLTTKETVVDEIARITNIEAAILTHTATIFSRSVAQRMSWAADRQTSRVEDRAYSLLGLFNVHMPMLYGEGKRAFVRLQEEIIRTSADHSIFSWEFEESEQPDGSLLATSPKQFKNCYNVVQWGKPKAFDMSNRGLRIPLRILKLDDGHDLLAILNCRLQNALSGTLALRLRKYGASDEYHAVRGLANSYPLEGEIIPGRKRLVSIYEHKIPRAMQVVQITRELETEDSKLKFWIPGIGGAFEILHVIPRELWDERDGIMHVAEGDVIRGGLVIKTRRGTILNIVLGFDRLHDETMLVGMPSVRTPMHGNRKDGAPEGVSSRRDTLERSSNQSQCARVNHHKLLLGLWASTSPEGDFPTLIQQSTPRCNHRNYDCEHHRCPFMHQRRTVRNLEKHETVELRIEASERFGDTVLTLSIEPCVGEQHPFMQEIFPPAVDRHEFI